jgi:hypothetical protein
VSLSRAVIIALTAISVVFGIAIVYWQPDRPLLAYWLGVAIVLGLLISLTGSINGIRLRAQWLITTFAILIGFALATTQLAARRTISTTHLTYHGVHLAGVDSFTIGAGTVQADVKLQTITPSQVPWLLQVTRADSGWTVAAVDGVEQVRLSLPGERDARDFDVAQSGVLHRDGDAVAVVDPMGNAVDTLRLHEGMLHSSRGMYSLVTTNDAIRRRYERRLRSSAALSMLEGRRSSPDVYERFIRVQTIGPLDNVNGSSATWAARLLGRQRLLISATPPYRLAGALVAHERLLVTDSSTVEVRNGDGTWRFVLHASWRREPSADPGVSVIFERGPRQLDTPLPVGVSCQQGVACGAISLRRLPPPIAHIALDHAGFDPERFGLLGTLRESDDGYSVVLPRETYNVERARTRPVAIPVVDLAQPLDDDARPMRWVLLGAAGQAEDAWMIGAIALGLALLLFGIYRTIAAVSSRLSVTTSRAHERAMMVGVTAILALLLARLTLGARVAFFEPFLETGIDSAVGMFVAIAVVAVGLMSWPEWLPALLMGARGTLTGQRSVRGLLNGIGRFTQDVVQRGTGAGALLTAGIVVSSLLLLAYFTDAVLYGMLAGGVVLLAWVCVAWVAAFTGPHFETYEKGAHAVVELLPAVSSVERTPDAVPGNAVTRLLRGAPELVLIIACVMIELAHILPRIALAAGIVMLLAVIPVVRQRRLRTHRAQQPDYFAASVAVAAFVICVAALRLLSENGSMGLFLLIVFVALASVRIGRSFGARLDAPRSVATRVRGRSLLESLLLLAPLLFLVPLAGIDMGLFLVMVVPLGFATLLAVGARTAGWRLIPLAVVMLVVLVLGRKVVFPSVRSIENAESHAAQAEAFADMSTLFGVRLPKLSTPMDRAAARSVATRDRELAEALLVAAGPGPARDLLVPSIEQIWGAKAYANAGWFGEGLGRAVVGGRGVAEAVSYAENTFSVFVLAEHGAIGGMLVLALYALLIGAIAALVIGSTTDIPSYRASRALFVVAGLIVAFPAVYVALSNIGLVPITGQNMPFLGLNAWSDVTICAGVVGILITGALRGLEEAKR